MNRKKHIFAPAAIITAVLMTTASCSYQEEPERTTDATTTYVTPKGELPTSEEKAYVQDLVNEYNEYIRTNKY